MTYTVASKFITARQPETGDAGHSESVQYDLGMAVIAFSNVQSSYTLKTFKIWIGKIERTMFITYLSMENTVT